MKLATVMKQEIERLAARVVRTEVGQARKLLASHRRHIATLRREVDTLKRELQRVRALAASAEPAQPTRGRGAKPRRFRADGFKSFRERGGFSGADFGLLMGVSGQTILNWESKRTKPSPEQTVLLAELRAKGVRELRDLLDAKRATAK